MPPGCLQQEDPVVVKDHAADEAVGVAPDEAQNAFYFDHAFTPSEQFKAQVRQAHCLVMNGLVDYVPINRGGNRFKTDSF